MNIDKKLLSALNEAMKGNYESAYSTYKLLSKKRPNDPKIWFGKAEIEKLMRKYDEALNSIDKSIQISPKEKDFLFFKVQLLKTMNKFREAEDLAETIVERNEFFMDAWFFYLNLLSRTKNITKFREKFKKMFIISKKFPKVSSEKSIGHYIKMPMITNDFYYDQVLEYRIYVGENSTESKNMEILIFKTYSDALKFFFDPKNTKQYSQLSYPRILVSQKYLFDVPERDLFENEPLGRQIEIDPCDVNVKLRSNAKIPLKIQLQDKETISQKVDRAKLFLELGNAKKGLKLLETVLKSDNRYYFAIWYSGYAHWLLKDCRQADKYFQQALDQNPKDYAPYTTQDIVRLQGEIHRDRAYMFHTQGEYKKAISDYDAATRFKPDDYLCWAYKSVCLKKMDEISEAEECLSESKRLYNMMLN